MHLCRIIYYSLAALHVSSDIFAHHQEHLNCIYSFWYYTCMSLPAGIMGMLELAFQLSHDTNRQRHTCVIPEAVNTVQMLLMMSENIARNTQSSQGIINYPKQLHLVGHFRKFDLQQVGRKKKIKNYLQAKIKRKSSVEKC